MLLWLAEHCSRTSCKVCTSRTLDGVVLLAACSFGFFFLARSNEFLPSQAVSSRALRGMDVAFKDEAGRTCEGLKAERLDVQFSSSKTDQEGFGTCRSHYAIRDPALQGICPVKVLAKLQVMAPQRFGHGAESHLGLFRWSTGDAVTRTEVQNALRRSAVAQGLPAERFATHSLRIGGASALFHSSGNLELVRRFGRWSSATYHRYLWGAAEETKGVAEIWASRWLACRQDTVNLQLFGRPNQLWCNFERKPSHRLWAMVDAVKAAVPRQKRVFDRVGRE
eukprot:3041450-Amphidinium_carterae.1